MTDLMVHGPQQLEVQELLRSSREVIARARTSSDRQRARTLAQRAHLEERRRRWHELVSGDIRIERLVPHAQAPDGLVPCMRIPRGRHAVVLLCGTCDEVLAAGTYAADLTVALRCWMCLTHNTGPGR